MGGVRWVWGGLLPAWGGPTASLGRLGLIHGVLELSRKDPLPHPPLQQLPQAIKLILMVVVNQIKA